MEMTATKTGIIGVLLVLAGFGGNQLLMPEQLDHAYICPLNEQVGVFDHLSTSGKTAYYAGNNSAEIAVSCRQGKVYAAWVPLREYSKAQGVDLDELINREAMKNTDATDSIPRRYECNGDCCNI